jgi:pimeloyl-ACP methyl ester carboxylesterase
MSRKAARIAFALGLWFLVLPLHLLAQGDGKLHLESCYLDEIQESVRCGWLKVPENRLVRKGRSIKVHFIILPALGTAQPDPVVTFAGGPGASALNGVARWARQFEKFRAERDILLIDQRGTGESNALPCRPLGDPNSAQTWLGNMYTVDYVTECRRKLEESADLKYYHTSLFVEDVEDIRAALGYPRLNILTGSYGTRVAIAYMERHPDRVRCAFLWSCNITDMRFPTFLAPQTQDSMDKLMDDCAGDPVASADYPNLRQDFEDVLARLRQGPVSLTLLNPLTDAPQTVTFGYYPFVAGIRSMLYSNATRIWVPLFIFAAARGDFSPAAEYTVAYMHDNNELYADGMYLCVECSENVSRMDLGEAYAQAAGTFMETYRVDQQKLACNLWPRADIAESYFHPALLDIPTLLLTGEDDPVTPPLYADIIAGFMVNSLRVIVPHWAHGFSPDTTWWKDGFDEVALQFVRQASVEGLDPSCVQSYVRPPFVSWRDYIQLAEEQKSLPDRAAPIKK